MRLFHWIAASAVLASSFLLTGCSGSSEPTESQAKSDLAANEAGAAQSAVKDLRSPEEVLREYLHLTQLGNQSEADKLLSPKAREVVNKVDLKLTAPAVENVHAKIGEVITVSEDRTRVAVRWVDGNGDPLSCDLTYKLRNVSQGWRVVGMIVPLFQGRVSALDFEDENMMRNFMQDMKKSQTASQSRSPKQGQVAKQNNGRNNSKPPLNTAGKPKPRNRVKQ